MRNSSIIALVAAYALAVFAGGCGNGDDAMTTFAPCGNGVVDPGEQCDDGAEAAANDTGGCLSTCVLATCGDGFIEAGVEQCDGDNLGAQSCGALAYAPGALRCDTQCQFDTNACGVQFTPTATRTPSATPSQTRTPTFTPTAGGAPTATPTVTVIPGGACIPSGITQVAVSFGTPSGQGVAAITVTLPYPADAVSIPGSGSEQSVANRVTGRPSGSVVTVNDLDEALQVGVRRLTTINPGPLFKVDFDSCAGAAPPTARDFDCVVEACQFGTIDGCTCAAQLQ